jgi:hypothetical protein
MSKVETMNPTKIMATRYNIMNAKHFEKDMPCFSSESSVSFFASLTLPFLKSVMREMTDRIIPMMLINLGTLPAVSDRENVIIITTANTIMIATVNNLSSCFRFKFGVNFIA